MKIQEIDKAMGYRNESLDGFDWYSADDQGFELDGLCWRKTAEPFRRLPFGRWISNGVNTLAWDTAGVMLRFKTDSPEIRIHAKIWNISRMDHMAHVGIMGFDLYLGSGTAKVLAGVTRFDHQNDEYNATVFGPDRSRKMREFTLHFPLYAHPHFLRIGLKEGSKTEAPSPWKDPRPVVVYGTSIQQGGCASRPGMCHTNRMSRMLNRPFVNLAFSGSGRGEPEMARTMAEIENPAMFVLDYDANAQCDGLDATLGPFLDILRAKHPRVPILLVSCLPMKDEFLENPECSRNRLRYTSIHLRELKRLRDAGDENIHFLDGVSLYGAEPSECTVDGCHATDLGFYRIAGRMAPVIERILTQ